MLLSRLCDRGPDYLQLDSVGDCLSPSSGLVRARTNSKEDTHVSVDNRRRPRRCADRQARAGSWSHAVIYDVAPRTEALADFVDLSRCVVIRGDVCNPLELVAAVKENGVRRIIHAAAFGGLTAGSNVAPLTSTWVNTMGTAYVLETARVLGLDRVVLCSSSTLYGSLTGGEDNGQYGYEEAWPRPDNVYAANKQAAEDLGRSYQNTFGLDVLAVRYAGVFGPWSPGGGGVLTWAVERWLRTAIAGESVEIDLSAGDWVYSKDAAKGTWLTCWVDKPDTRLFNLSMGRLYGPDDVAEALNAAVPGNLAKASASAVAPSRPPMNIERARQQLGYEVEFPMERALADYRDWMVKKGQNQ